MIHGGFEFMAISERLVFTGLRDVTGFDENPKKP